VILQRYIYREILQKLLAVAGLLLLIFISKYYVEYLADAAAGKISGNLVLQMLSLKILSILPRLLPVTLFLAVILAFSRLNRDNELAIYHASGAGLNFQLLTALRFATVFLLVFAVITLWLAPWAEHRMSFIKEAARKDSDITGLTAGQFKEFSKGDRVVYLEKLSDDKQAMENVFLQVRQNNKLGVLTSDRARFSYNDESGHRYIVFEDGRRYVGSPGMLDYQITDYESYAVLIESSGIQALTRPLEATDTLVLLQSGSPAHRAELQWRASMLILTLALVICGVLLNGNTGRGDRQYMLLFIGMLVYFIYSNLLGISKTLLKRDVLSPWIGLWWVHVLILAGLMFMYYLPHLRRKWRDKGPQQILPARS
jgi:lipopolysaccharide export system permease protein